MKQGFRVIPFDAYFESEVNKICNEFRIVKWEFINTETFLGKESVLVEFRTKFVVGDGLD